MRRRQRQAGQQRRRRFLGQAREGRRAASRHQVLGPLRGVRPPAAHEGVQGRRRARADRQRAGRYATLFKQGAHQILDPKFKDGTYKRVAEQAVPDWDNQQALTIFEQMLQRTTNKIDGVLAANDGLANPRSRR
jgi:substrate-binding family protein